MLPSLAQCAERCEPIPILHEKREAIDTRKRAALADSLVEIVAAEILTSVAGSIGSEIKQASQIFEVTELFAWTLVAIVFSLALEGAFALAGVAKRRRT